MIRLAGKGLTEFVFGPITHADPGGTGVTTYTINHNLNSLHVLYDVGYKTSLVATSLSRLDHYTTNTEYRGLQMQSASVNTINLNAYRIVASTTFYLYGKVWLPN